MIGVQRYCCESVQRLKGPKMDIYQALTVVSVLIALAHLSVSILHYYK
jgi:hypothetical protein